MGNIADYMQSGGEGQHWRYDFRKGVNKLYVNDYITHNFLHFPNFSLYFGINNFQLRPAVAFIYVDSSMVAQERRRASATWLHRNCFTLWLFSSHLHSHICTLNID